LINLQNAAGPKRAIDVRGIRFVKAGHKNVMEIDLYADDYGRPAHEDELSGLWDNVFLARDFWNADFEKVRVTVRNRESDDLLETISCDFEDVSRYLLKEISLAEFQDCWDREQEENARGGKLVRLRWLKRA
ncbi:MAG TPA: hypothetical protein VE439_07105, partial [Anaerolineae bacterium]|nr:hypothetical protein [Anaerolineae bacterium]